MRVTRTPRGVELYFPPLRHVGTALALGLFGAITAALGAAGSLALLHGALGDTSGIMSAVLVASFAVPFALFGVVFVALAIYMAMNALTVQVDAVAISAHRTLLGMSLARRGMAASEVQSIEPQIATRDQSPFTAEPVYRLYAIDRERARRIVVAESLTGDALMQKVKEILEGEINGRK